MNAVMLFYVFVLFFVLTPGILLSLPPKGSKYVVAGVHALVFAIVWGLTHKFVWKRSVEGFSEGTDHMNEKDKEKKPTY